MMATEKKITLKLEALTDTTLDEVINQLHAKKEALRKNSQDIRDILRVINFADKEFWGRKLKAKRAA